MEKAKNHNAETDAVKSSNVREFKTNIQPLDRLLGYNEDIGRGTGIKAGDIIVLRGGPGSGKTTLGLQIMSNYLASDSCRCIGKKPAAVFISLELEATTVIEKVKRDFGFFKEREELLETFPTYRLRWFLRMLGFKFCRWALAPLINAIISFLLFLSNIFPGLHILVVPLIQEVYQWVRAFIVNPSKVSKPKRKSEDSEEFEGILFIDSINALLTMVHQYAKLDEWESRLALNSALYSVRKIFNRFVIIISSEFHHEKSWVPTGMSESFISDVEILLSSEPIAVPLGYETGQQGSVGYNIFKIIEKVEGEEGTKLESRSFIRVLKNRKGANQSRRCAYDLVPGVGVQFYETYPADGHILLFSENPMQKQVWDTFFKEDLPQIYPTLRYEAFGRYGLQRTFLNQRRSRYVPSRTDMYVSSFDNYWINWYGELCWKRAIVDVVEPQIQTVQTDKERQRIVAELASAIHKSLMKNPPELQNWLSVELKECLTEYLQQEQEGDQNEVLISFASLSRRSNCVKCFMCRSCSWLLEKISKDENEKTSFEQACKIWAKRKTKGKSNKKRPDLEPMINILERMNKSTDGCCRSSLVRRFFDEYIKSRVWQHRINCLLFKKPNDAITLIWQLKEIAYKDFAVTKEFRKIKTKEICSIFKNAQENCAFELSKKIDELGPWLRSNDVRNKLEEKLWALARNPKDKKLESKIHQILCEFFKKYAGCECHVEFWKYLGGTLSEKIDDARNESEEKDKSKEKEKFERIYKTLYSHRHEIMNELFEALPPVLLEDPKDGPKDSESIVSLWKKHTEQKDYPALYNLITTYHEIIKNRNKLHFLSSLPNEELRLFGERRSRIIKELEKSSPDDNRPIHRPGLLFSLRDTKSFVAVPYDANIGFMVCRHDLLKKVIKGRFCKKNVPNKNLDKYADDVFELYKKQLIDLNQTSALTKEQGNEVEKQRSKVKEFVKNNITQYIDDIKEDKQYNAEDKRPHKVPIQTWEELVVLLKLMNKGNDGRHFVIESQSLDTLLCTILEFFWNCGGELNIRPDYSIKNPNYTKQKLSQALYLLGTMLREGIITDDSTLDVIHFAKRYDKSEKSSNKSEDWVFARYWYTTLVDMLTAKKNLAYQTYIEGSFKTEISSPAFLWQNSGAQLGIMPMPVSLSYYFEKLDALKKLGKEKEEVPHRSCWGDWHWIMTEGTENTELGVDLINNLINSQKVCERAFQCAAIPTVEEFYKLHGNSSCLNLPERSYETPKMIPNITFKELRDTYFPDACSRSQIFDYEHCMLELQSLFQTVRSLAKNKSFDWEGKLKEKLDKEIKDAFDRINALRTKLTLTV